MVSEKSGDEEGAEATEESATGEGEF